MWLIFVGHARAAVRGLPVCILYDASGVKSAAWMMDKLPVASSYIDQWRGAAMNRLPCDNDDDGVDGS